jgi:serine O-acetyltransferase
VTEGNDLLNANTWTGLVAHLRADLFRYHGRAGRYEFISSMLREPGFKLTFWLRVSWFLFDKPAARIGPYWIARFLWSHYRFKYGVHIDINTKIGPGFYLCHVGGIVVNNRCVIGKNCNLSNDVTIGIKRGGIPVIGDNVYIAPGAKIFGELSIGDHVAIGANAVVTKSVPANGVAVGIPAQVISDSGSGEFVNQTEWEQA